MAEKLDALRNATLEPIPAAADVKALARLVVDRVRSVYREDYIARCVANEPDSLLALVDRLDKALLTGIDPCLTHPPN
jgi:hypothetical protein